MKSILNQAAVRSFTRITTMSNEVQFPARSHGSPSFAGSIAVFDSGRVLSWLVSYDSIELFESCPTTHRWLPDGHLLLKLFHSEPHDSIAAAPQAVIHQNRIHLFVVSTRGCVWRYNFAPHFVGDQLSAASVLSRYDFDCCPLRTPSVQYSHFTAIDFQTVVVAPSEGSASCLIVCTHIGQEKWSEHGIDDDFWKKAEPPAPQPKSSSFLSSALSKIAVTGLGLFKKAVVSSVSSVIAASTKFHIVDVMAFDASPALLQALNFSSNPSQPSIVLFALCSDCAIRVTLLSNGQPTPLHTIELSTEMTKVGKLCMFSYNNSFVLVAAANDRMFVVDMNAICRLRSAIPLPPHFELHDFRLQHSASGLVIWALLSRNNLLTLAHIFLDRSGSQWELESSSQVDYLRDDIEVVANNCLEFTENCVEAATQICRAIAEQKPYETSLSNWLKSVLLQATRDGLYCGSEFHLSLPAQLASLNVGPLPLSAMHAALFPWLKQSSQDMPQDTLWFQSVCSHFECDSAASAFLSVADSQELPIALMTPVHFAVQHMPVDSMLVRQCDDTVSNNNAQLALLLGPGHPAYHLAELHKHVLLLILCKLEQEKSNAMAEVDLTSLRRTLLQSVSMLFCRAALMSCQTHKLVSFGGSPNGSVHTDLQLCWTDGLTSPPSLQKSALELLLTGNLSASAAVSHLLPQTSESAVSFFQLAQLFMSKIDSEHRLLHSLSEGTLHPHQDVENPSESKSELEWMIALLQDEIQEGVSQEGLLLQVEQLLSSSLSVMHLSPQFCTEILSLLNSDAHPGNAGSSELSLALTHSSRELFQRITTRTRAVLAVTALVNYLVFSRLSSRALVNAPSSLGADTFETQLLPSLYQRLHSLLKCRALLQMPLNRLHDSSMVLSPIQPADPQFHACQLEFVAFPSETDSDKLKSLLSLTKSVFHPAQALSHWWKTFSSPAIVAAEVEVKRKHLTAFESMSMEPHVKRAKLSASPSGASDDIISKHDADQLLHFLTLNVRSVADLLSLLPGSVQDDKDIVGKLTAIALNCSAAFSVKESYFPFSLAAAVDILTTLLPDSQTHFPLACLYLHAFSRAHQLNAIYMQNNSEALVSAKHCIAAAVQLFIHAARASSHTSWGNCSEIPHHFQKLTGLAQNIIRVYSLLKQTLATHVHPSACYDCVQFAQSLSISEVIVPNVSNDTALSQWSEFWSDAKFDLSIEMRDVQAAFAVIVSTQDTKKAHACIDRLVATCLLAASAAEFSNSDAPIEEHESTDLHSISTANCLAAVVKLPWHSYPQLLNLLLHSFESQQRVSSAAEPCSVTAYHALYFLYQQQGEHRAAAKHMLKFALRLERESNMGRISNVNLLIKSLQHTLFSLSQVADANDRFVVMSDKSSIPVTGDMATTTSAEPVEQRDVRLQDEVSIKRMLALASAHALIIAHPLYSSENQQQMVAGWPQNGSLATEATACEQLCAWGMFEAAIELCVAFQSSTVSVVEQATRCAVQLQLQLQKQSASVSDVALAVLNRIRMQYHNQQSVQDIARTHSRSTQSTVDLQGYAAATAAAWRLVSTLVDSSSAVHCAQVMLCADSSMQLPSWLLDACQDKSQFTFTTAQSLIELLVLHNSIDTAARLCLACLKSASTAALNSPASFIPVDLLDDVLLLLRNNELQTMIRFEFSQCMALSRS